MKAQPYLPENHFSYQRHRHQVWRQILLPFFLVLSLVVIVAVLVGLAAFGEHGETTRRWAAISTIWLVIPLMVFGLLFLVILLALIYLLARALQVIPPYSANAQYYVNRAAAKIQRISDISVEPIFFLESIFAGLKRLFGR